MKKLFKAIARGFEIVGRVIEIVVKVFRWIGRFLEAIERVGNKIFDGLSVFIVWFATPIGVGTLMASLVLVTCLQQTYLLWIFSLGSLLILLGVLIHDLRAPAFTPKKPKMVEVRDEESGKTMVVEVEEPEPEDYGRPVVVGLFTGSVLALIVDMLRAAH